LSASVTDSVPPLPRVKVNASPEKDEPGSSKVNSTQPEPGVTAVAALTGTAVKAVSAAAVRIERKNIVNPIKFDGCEEYNLVNKT
jgi:hypothetical protein